MVKANEKYEAVVISAGFTKNNSPTMKFKTADGEVSWFGNIGTAALPSEKGIEIAAKALTAAGFLADSFEDLNNLFEIVFKPQTVEIVTEEYKGKVRVKWVNTPGEQRERRTVDGALIPSGKAAFKKLKSDSIPF